MKAGVQLLLKITCGMPVEYPAIHLDLDESGCAAAVENYLRNTQPSILTFMKASESSILAFIRFPASTNLDLDGGKACRGC